MSYSDDLIVYRREKAARTFQDAELLFDAGSYNSAVNRIYYSMFYEVTALLLKKEMSSTKHSGIRALFNEHFVKSSIVSTESGRFYGSMFDFRQKSDYGDFATFEKERVQEWLERAERFITELENLFNSNG